MPRNANFLKFPCMTAKQGKYQLICFVAPAHVVWKFVKVNRRESDKDEGYQRALSDSRVSALKRYIDSGNTIPNSILLSLDHGAIVSRDGQSVRIPNKEDAGWVIDGQHRLAGAHEAGKNIELVVIAFIGLAEDEQIKQFITINREAKGVPTSLYYDLLKHLPPGKSDSDAAKERAVDIANDLRKREASPFYQRIVVDPPKSGQLSLTNFVRKVAPLVIDKKGRFHTYLLNEQVGIFDNFYRALENVFPQQFRDGRSTFFKTLGFGAMINSLQTIFELSLTEHHGFKVEDATNILKKIEDFDFSQWDKMGTGTQAELQAGDDFRQRLVARVQQDHPETGTLRL
jgi:DGQHR domain-containing protein